MNNTTSTPAVSRVIDIDALKSEARALDLPLDRPTLRRVRRAINILEAPNAINLLISASDARVYEVGSQCVEGKKHLVVSNGQVKCTCADARQGHKCKHGFAIRMRERQPQPPTFKLFYPLW